MRLGLGLAGGSSCLGLIAALLVLPVAALASPLRWSGEASASIWSSDRKLNDDEAIAVSRAESAVDWRPSESVSLRAEGWAMSAPERLDGKRTSAGLKEMFAEARTLPCTPALGKKLISWGKTDALNPTDQLSPTNFRRLVAKDTSQREGVWGLHLNCAAGAGRVQAHLLDRFRFNDVPLAERAGIEFQNDKPRLRATKALRYEAMGSSADWSVSFIDGHDLNPTLAVRSVSAQGVLVGRDATPMQMVGGDLAITHGKMVYRAEAAWVRYPGQMIGAHAQRRPYAYVVVQAEHGLGDRETVSVQAFGKQLRGELHASGNPLLEQLQFAQGLLGNELDHRSYGLTLRYARPLWDSRADMDVFVVYARPRNDWMLRSRVTYALSDSLRISAGFDAFRGPAASYLGNLRANSLAFAELSATW